MRLRKRTTWPQSLDRVAALVDAFSVDLLGVDLPSYGLAFVHSGGKSRWTLGWTSNRIWRSRLSRAGDDPPAGGRRVVHDHAHYDDAFIASAPFYRDFLIPMGGRFVSAVKLYESADRAATLTVVRGPQAGPLDEQAIADLESLSGHLVRALDLARYLETRQGLPLPGSELLDRFSRPMAIVDERCTVLYANAACRALLARGDPVIDRSGVLALRQTEDDRRLSRRCAGTTAWRAAWPIRVASSMLGGQRRHGSDVAGARGRRRVGGRRVRRGSFSGADLHRPLRGAPAGPGVGGAGL